jgi:poly(ADP-ribose) glycohydrolase ARH3
MVGDTLGASDIKAKVGRVTDFIAGSHMGIREEGPRCGMYTDDTNSCLALAESVVRCQGVDGADAARANAARGLHSCPRRGYPGSALNVMRAIESGADHRATGRAEFPDGSWANGGAMRIAPVALCCRSLPAEVGAGQAQ